MRIFRITGLKSYFNKCGKPVILNNHKKVHRLYVEMGLNLKRKPKKRLSPRTKQTLSPPNQLNHCWSFDYMSDALVSGYRFRTANFIDDSNREVLGIEIAFSLPSRPIIHWLDCIALNRGYPRYLRVDNAPENISYHFKNWASSHGIELLYIQPGKPAQNGYIQRFNRSYREAVLDRYLFKTIRQVKIETAIWLQHYNHERPHEAWKNKTPLQFAREHLSGISNLTLGRQGDLYIPSMPYLWDK